MTPEDELELKDAERQAQTAFDAMNAWIDRAFDAVSDTPAAVLEGHARTLRRSRERIQTLIERYGERDQLTAARDRNTLAHEGLGLRIYERETPG